jgi:NAD+ diphosphatase
MTLTYSNMPLDRCTNQRKNKRWLSAEFSHTDTLFCVIKEDMNFFNKNDDLSPYYVTKQQLSEQQVDTLRLDSCIYLGKGKSGSVFSIDYDKLRFSVQERLDECGQWLGLRQVTGLLKATDAATLALAKGLVYWHKTHQYCGRCGNINKSVEAGHARKCTECRNLTFPRTDPAVIMLVERLFEDGIARCLLGRQASWAEGVYSTLAGFVDPGETLEEAVIREVLEETAVNVIDPQYITSQPWPFPASVMLGFTAQATSEYIDITQDDLEVAQWFTREQLESFTLNKKMGSPQQQTQGFKMSSSDSISSYLITAWKNKEIGKY